jgi:flagellin
MASTSINTNINSMNAQRNLSMSANSLATSMQRLSSGLRVNSAKDDAAGLAIAERMNSQVRGLSVAARNANDGVSLAQTAEGALGKIGDMVQRVRELAVQSSNATNNNTDRAALQSEVSQLMSEIDRVANTTTFNGTKLIDGSFTSAIFQVGANADEKITVSSITNASLAGMGVVNNATVSVATSTITGSGALAAGSMTVNGVDIGALAAVGSVSQRAAQLVDAINNKSQQTGVGAALDNTTGQITLSSSADIVIAGSGAATAIGFSAGTTTASASGNMASLSVTGYGSAQLAIRQADAALSQINTARANLGAIQSRFESAVSNIQIQSESISAAKSRIMDTDFAAETANLTRAQILQQAGNAMLSQANQLPQSVLSLLR